MLRRWPAFVRLSPLVGFALAVLACGPSEDTTSTQPTSPQGGAAGGGNDAGGDPGSGGAGGVSTGAGGSGPSLTDVVVGVGWQGLRMLSIDEGQTWCETGLMVDGHDDLFRGAGYHDGLFVGAHAGSNNNGAIWTTTNGYDWTALHQTNEDLNLPPNPSGQWYGGAAWGNGIWLAGGGCGRLATSADGLSWTSVPRFTNGCVHIRSLAFGEAQFVAGVDDGNWYSSTDGVNWSVLAQGAGSFVVALESGLSGPIGGDRFYQGRGVCLAGIGSPNFGVKRSTAPDCSNATRVADTVHRPTTFLFGQVPIADIDRSRMSTTLADCLSLP